MDPSLSKANAEAQDHKKDLSFSKNLSGFFGWCSLLPDGSPLAPGRGDEEEPWKGPPRTASLLPFLPPCSGPHHQHCMPRLPRPLVQLGLATRRQHPSYSSALTRSQEFCSLLLSLRSGGDSEGSPLFLVPWCCIPKLLFEQCLHFTLSHKPLNSGLMEPPVKWEL